MMNKRYVYVVLSRFNNRVFFDAFDDLKEAKEEFRVPGTLCAEYLGIVRVRAYAPIITLEASCVGENDIMIRLHTGGTCEYDTYVLCDKRDLAHARNLKKSADFEPYPLRDKWGDI